jgi:hypothetical protein
MDKEFEDWWNGFFHEINSQKETAQQAWAFAYKLGWMEGMKDAEEMKNNENSNSI